jgi:hypothetical protein
MKKQFIAPIMVCLCILSVSLYAQTEILTNSQIVEMSKIGLDKQIILKKINDTPNNFDVSVNALIELKKAGVDSEVIALMLEKAEAKPTSDNSNSQNYSENVPTDVQNQSSQNLLNPQQSLLTARTVAIEKSSIHPSRQALEKELMKRNDWKKLNLSIVRYKDSADLYIEIGRVPFTWITHRYVFRVYDRRNGLIIAAGETTSWGSLAKNLAREITQKMNAVMKN